MSENDKQESDNQEKDSSGGEEPTTDTSGESGPTFTEAPDPLAGVKKGATDVLDSMEGKTVSMKTYVGTIIGIIVLMLLARCGG